MADRQPDTDAAAGRARKALWRVLRIVLTGALLYWVLSQVSLEQVLTTLRTANPRLLALAFILYQVGVLVRTLRWTVLLRGSGLMARYPIVLGLTYIGQFFNLSLPTGLAGDAVRAMEYEGEQSKVTTAGIVLLDRVVGMATLFTFALVGLAFGYRLLVPTTALVLTIVSIGGLAVAILIFQRNLILRLTRFLPKPISLAGEGRLARLYAALTGCAPSSVAGAVALSAVNTALTVTIHFTAAKALDVALGFGVFAMLTPIVNLGLLVPSIGGLGLNEFGYQLLLTPLGVTSQVAVALGFGVYLTRLSAALIGGLYYLVWTSRR